MAIGSYLSDIAIPPTVTLPMSEQQSIGFQTAIRPITLGQAYSTAAREVQTYVAIDADVLHGVACISGTRIPVWIILHDLACGYSIDKVVSEYPSLTRDQVIAAIEFAAAVMEIPPGVSFGAMPEREITPRTYYRDKTETAEWLTCDFSAMSTSR